MSTIRAMWAALRKREGIERLLTSTDLQIAVVYAAVLFVFALYVTRPLLFHLGEAIPFGSTPVDRLPTHLRPADSTQLHYWLWLFKDNIENFRSPLASPWEFGPLNPTHQNMMGMWGFPLHLPFLVLAWVFGTTAAFNLLILLSFPLTALSQAWLCRVLGTRWSTAMIAGVVYGFAFSRRVQMFGGHANGWLYLHLPLLLATLYLALEKRSKKWAALFGVCLFSIGLGEWHCFYYSSLFLGPAFVFFAWRTRFFRPANIRTLLVIAVLSGVSTASIGYAFWIKSSLITGTRAATNRSIGQVKHFSPDPDLLTEAKRYQEIDIWGGSEMEPSVYLGNSMLASFSAVLFLAAFLFLSGAKRTRSRSPQPSPNVRRTPAVPASEVAASEVAASEVASAEFASAEVASAEVASAEVASAEVASAEVALTSTSTSRLSSGADDITMNNAEKASETPTLDGPLATKPLGAHLLFFVAAGVFSLVVSLGVRDDVPGLYEFLHEHFPFWNLSRVPPRLIYLAHASFALALACLLDLFFAELFTLGRRVYRSRWLILGAIGIALVVDYVALAPKLLLSKQPDGGGAIYDKVRSMSVEETGPLLFFPIYGADNAQNSAFLGIATTLRRPFLNGYAPTAPVAAHALLVKLSKMNRGGLDASAHCELWKTGARYVVHDTTVHFLRHSGAKKTALADLEKAGILAREVSSSDGHLYRILEPEECR